MIINCMCLKSAISLLPPLENIILPLSYLCHVYFIPYYETAEYSYFWCLYVGISNIDDLPYTIV